MANSSVSLNIPDPATQADMETATSVTKPVTPGRQQFHPSAAKVWGLVTDSSGTTLSLVTSYNITSISDDDVGIFTVTIANDLSSVNYVIAANSQGTDDTNIAATDLGTQSKFYTRGAGSFICRTTNFSGAAQDMIFTEFCVFGDI